MGLMLAEPDFHTRCFVEWEEYPRQSLIAAQRAGYFAPAPIWDDVTTFDAKPLAGAIDTLLAGYPCQPFSHAGQRKGENDERHLWPDIERIIGELGESLRWCFFENVAGHLTLGLETVLRRLRDLGFTPAAGVFSAEEAGAPHERQRVFIVAYRQPREATIWNKLADCGRYSNAPPSRDNRKISQISETESGSKHGPDVFDRCGDTLAYRASADGERDRREPAGWERSTNSGCELANANSVDGGADRRKPHAGPDRRHISRGCQPRLAHPDGGDTCAEREQRGGEQRFQQACRETGGEDVAHSNFTGLEGQRTNIDHPKGWQEPHGSTRLRGRAGVFPPGPRDVDAWGAILGTDQTRAPAIARRDAKAAALNFAALFTPEEAQAIVQRSGSMEIGEILRAVGEEAPRLVGQSEAFTGFRDVAYGLASRTRALRLLGNGVCPLAAGYAWRTLSYAHGLGRVDLGT